MNKSVSNKLHKQLKCKALLLIKLTSGKICKFVNKRNNMKYYIIKILNHYTLENRELISKVKIEIGFREPYIDFKKDMIKTWEVPLHNHKMMEMIKIAYTLE